VATGAYCAVILAGGAGRRLGGEAKPTLPVAGEPMLARVLAAVADAAIRVVVGPPALAPMLPNGVHLIREHPPGGGPVAGLAAGLGAVRELDVDAARGLLAGRGYEASAGGGSEAAAGGGGEVAAGGDGEVMAAGGGGEVVAGGDGEVASGGDGEVVAGGDGEVVAAGGDGEVVCGGDVTAREVTGTAWTVVLAADLPLLSHVAIERLLTRGTDSTVDGVVYVDGDGRRQWLCAAWRTDALWRRIAELGTPTGRSVTELVSGLRVATVSGRPGEPPPWYDCDTVDDLQQAERWSRAEECTG
jgi:molybdopterin-guanine dinucleotide biosynthesis protein A